MARKLTAGPAPDGGFVTRKTDNDYSFAVVIFDTTPRRYKPGAAGADEFGYVPNPTINTWVGESWHGRRDLAVKSCEKFRRMGYKAVIVPVVDDATPAPVAAPAEVASVDVKDIRDELINMLLASGAQAQASMRNSLCVRRNGDEPIFTVTVTVGGSLSS